MKSGVIITEDNLASVIKSITALAGKAVLVGIPDSDPGRKEDEPINNASIGYIQEFGAPASNIPPRPFLIPGVKEAQPQSLDRMKKAAEMALAGDSLGADRQLQLAGMNAMNKVRALINSGISPALAPSTLRARRKRGRTGEVPLIDTGQLRNSITYVVLRKK